MEAYVRTFLVHAGQETLTFTCYPQLSFYNAAFTTQPRDESAHAEARRRARASDGPSCQYSRACARAIIIIVFIIAFLFLSPVLSPSLFVLSVIIILVIIFAVSMCFILYDYLARRVMDLLAVRSQQTAHMVSMKRTASAYCHNMYMLLPEGPAAAWQFCIR